jgi:hypothetical protein
MKSTFRGRLVVVGCSLALLFATYGTVVQTETAAASALSRPAAQACRQSADEIAQNLSLLYGRGPSVTAQHEERLAAANVATTADEIAQNLDTLYGRGPSATAQHEARVNAANQAATADRGSETGVCS